MAVDPEELLPRKKAGTEIILGQDLSAISAHELAARIAAMETRSRAAGRDRGARKATKNAAAAFF